MDRRVRRSRQAIFSAFEGLLAEKRYEQITVGDIIERADVGRSTFYAHFETKDDLLRSTCDELFHHVFEDHPAAEASHDFSGATATLPGMLTHILYHLRDDRDRYARIFSCASADLFWASFKDHLASLVQSRGLPKALCEQGVPEVFFLNWYCSSFAEAVRWWFRSGLGATPEELESFFEKVTGTRR